MGDSEIYNQHDLRCRTGHSMKQSKASTPSNTQHLRSISMRRTRRVRPILDGWRIDPNLAIELIEPAVKGTVGILASALKNGWA